jgi:hypothetical protein
MRTAVVIVLALAGFGLAACGSGAKPTAHYRTPPETTQGGSTLTLTSPTTLTVASATTGALVRCTNHGIAAGARVPSPGHGVGGSADGTSASATLTLTRNSDGSLVVSCQP